MAKMRRETLVRKMLQDPAAVREFLDCCSPELLAQFFPDHEIKVKMITVKSLQSGKDVTIPANTPWALRPDSETYWSM